MATKKELAELKSEITLVSPLLTFRQTPLSTMTRETRFTYLVLLLTSANHSNSRTRINMSPRSRSSTLPSTSRLTSPTRTSSSISS